jgi:hypothetical protein
MVIFSPVLVASSIYIVFEVVLVPFEVVLCSLRGVSPKRNDLKRQVRIEKRRLFASSLRLCFYFRLIKTIPVLTRVLL